MDDRTLAPGEKLVALALLRHANREGRCRVRNARIAELTGFSLATVKRAIAGLRRRPWFHVKRTGRSTAFRIDAMGAVMQANLFSNAHAGLWKPPMKSCENPADMEFAMAHGEPSDGSHGAIHRSRVLEAGTSNPAASPRASHTATEEKSKANGGQDGPPKSPARGAWGRASECERNRIAELEWELRRAHRLLRVEREDDTARELRVGRGPRD